MNCGFSLCGLDLFLSLEGVLTSQSSCITPYYLRACRIADSWRWLKDVAFSLLPCGCIFHITFFLLLFFLSFIHPSLNLIIPFPVFCYKQILLTGVDGVLIKLQILRIYLRVSLFSSQMQKIQILHLNMVCRLADGYVIHFSLISVIGSGSVSKSLPPIGPAGNRGLKWFDNWEGRRCNMSLGSVDLICELCFSFRAQCLVNLIFAEGILPPCCV